jgi:hypothetical protein
MEEHKINKSKLRFANKVIQTKKLSENAKAVLVFLQWHDKMINKAKYDKIVVSYRFMEDRFGINSKIYKASLKELKREKFITTTQGMSRKGNKIIFIKLLTPPEDKQRYELFENVYATTPVFTPKQKVFIGMFYHILENKDNSGFGETSLSEYAITKAMLDFGVAESTTKDRLRELTYDNTLKIDSNANKKKEYVEIFLKDENGYCVDMDVLDALYRLDNLLLGQAQTEAERAKVTGEDEIKPYPIYKKSDCHKYWYDEETKQIIKDN